MGSLLNAQPENDNCVDAIAIGLSEEISFQTLGATIDGPAHPGLPCFSFGDSLIHHDIWYSFSPTASEFVEWTTCGTAQFDTRLAVYDDTNACTFSEEDLLYCNDDGVDCSGFTSYLSFEAEAGETYYLRLGGFQSGDFGMGSFIINPISNPEVPSNSNCEDHTFVGVVTTEQADAGMGWKTGNNFNALQENDVEEPDCIPQGEFYDVWYSFENGGNDSIEIRFETLTEGALFNIQIYDTCGVKALNQADGGELLDVCFLNSAVESGSMWLVGFEESQEYLMQIATQITNHLPGEFRFQLVGQTEAVSVFDIDLSDQVEIFPNPSHGIIQIKSPFKYGQIQLIDFSGKVLVSSEFIESSFSMDLSSLSKGIYLLSMANDNKMTVSKIAIH